MPSLTASWSRLTGRASAPQPAFDPHTVLTGLAPSLVIDLARQAGSSLDDLQVTLQLMPWGDRATLAAYDVVTLDGPADRPGRRLTVQPIALDVVAAAAEVVAAAAEPHAVARVLSDLTEQAAVQADAAVPVDVRKPLDDPANGTHVLEGVVEAVRIVNGRKLVEVASAGAGPGGFAQSFTVAPTSELIVSETSPVLLTVQDRADGGVVPVGIHTLDACNAPSR